VDDVTLMFDEECTCDNVSGKIKEVGGRCNTDDCFIFYFAGHAACVRDPETDALDGCFCFVDKDDQFNNDTVMSDDAFARVVTNSCPKGCQILILTDCRHTGPVVDLRKETWASFEAVSMAGTGSHDERRAGKNGKNGIFTHSVLMAVDKIHQEQEEGRWSLGKLYNTALHFDDQVFNNAQNITIQTCVNAATNSFAWPLCPTTSYMNPLLHV
jgi:hypothetical protein